MTKHTPGPWAVSGYVLNFGRVITRADHLGRNHGAAADPERCRKTYMQTIASVSQHPCHLVGGVAEAEANAEFIVRACNSHDDLVAALKTICAADDVKSLAGIVDALDAARAAIAKAEEPSD